MAGTTADLDEVQRLQASGLTYDQIAEALGVSRTTVYRTLQPVTSREVAQRKVTRRRLRKQWPTGTLVLGPFRVRHDGRGWHEGVGEVDWSLLSRPHRIPVSHKGVPVRVLVGNRQAGGYEPGELRRMTDGEQLEWRRLGWL